MARTKPPKPPKLTRYEEWLASGQLVPTVVLAVDPGNTAGASLLAAGPQWGDSIHVEWVRTIATNTLALERAIDDAVLFARRHDMTIVCAIEEWGAGGNRGIDQWLGLGAAAGAWKRAVILACERFAAHVGNGGTVPLVKTRSIMRVSQSTWRSAIIPETGVRTPSGKWVPFDSEGWKKAATRRYSDLYASRGIRIDTADAAESLLLGTFAMRSRELAKLLPERYLKQRGFEVEVIDVDVPRRRARRAVTVSRDAGVGAASPSGRARGRGRVVARVGSPAESGDPVP